MSFEKLFDQDIICKRERVERALRFQPLDRVPLHEQLSYNPHVIAHYTQKKIDGFQYSKKDIGTAIRKSLDIAFPIYEPIGTRSVQDDDGIVFKYDNWTKWIQSRPFSDEHGAKVWLLNQTQKKLRESKRFDSANVRKQHLAYLQSMQSLMGETVILDISETGFCDVFDRMGLEIFTFFYHDYPKVFHDYLCASMENAVRKVHAIAENSISPAILIAEDFCTKQGSIFSPEFLKAEHYPFVKELVKAWREHGYYVIYHTDGNFKKEIQNLMDCGVQGFYCLERNCGMHIEELRMAYPAMFWAGGVDGVDLMESGSPEQVHHEVLRIIDATNALEKGGIFIDTSSEINPPIPVKNFVAMVNAVNERRNTKI